MQNKGAILTLAILFALVSLYYLSFTWVTSSVESDAKAYTTQFEAEAKKLSHGDIYQESRYLRMKEQLYLDSIGGESVYPLLGFTYRECQERELNLGLDLRGGMNVTMEVSVVDLIRSMSNNSTDSTFVASLRLAQQKQKNSQADFLDLFYESFTEIDSKAQLASVFSTLDLKDRISFTTSNAEVVEILREEIEGAIDNSFNILRTRIDKFGVTQPNIQRLEGNAGRILVELPGVKDQDRVRKLLQGTANLEFWETYSTTEIWQSVTSANDRLRQLLQAEASAEELAVADTTATDVAVADTTASAEDLINNMVDETSTEATVADVADSTNQSLVEKIGGDSTKTADIASADQFNKQNPLFAVLKPMTDNQGNLAQGAVVGYSHAKDTSVVNRHLNRREIKGIFPRNLHFAWEVKAFDENGEYFNLIALKSSRDGKPALSGDVVTDARAAFGDNQATAVVNMNMDSDGAKTWAQVTKQNIGKSVAIVLDGYVYSYPTVRSEISGGSSEISGNFTVNEAKDLANVLKSGKMPAPARIIEEAVVGPSLGQEAITAGLSSFVLAFVLVLVYMVFYYSRSGVIADIALIANIFFIFGVLASLGAVLTLPGIAGIVLTIGMSVDANVLIFERVKEELALGKSFRTAISDGYKNAYSAIIDGNVTTLLTAIVLYIFGHGPIRGFATTLIIGILSSLFSAIFITRLIYIGYINKNKELPFTSRFTANAFKNVNFNFLGGRKKAYILSGTIILIGIISMFVRGWNPSVDFTGGRTYVVRFEQPVNTVELANSLKGVFGEAPEVKTFGPLSQVKITTQYLIEDNATTVDSIVETKLYEGLKPVLGADVTKQIFLDKYRQSSNKVGPTIADDIMVSAIWAISFALIIMFLYIFARFRRWEFGLGALVALMHDVLIVLSLFSLFYGILPFSLEIDQAFIAAILTVVGYSINDTVIIFDRIREYIGLNKKDEQESVFNNALNSTLGRTFSTSFSTLLVLIIIFFFGGEVIRGFIFALLAGIIVGTYSSLFIATPITFDAMMRKGKEVEAEKVLKK